VTITPRQINAFSRGSLLGGLAAASLLTAAGSAFAQIIEESTPPAAATTAPPRRHYVHHTKPKPATATVAPARGFSAPKLLWRTLLHRCDGAPAAAGDAVFTTAGTSLYALDAGGHTLSMAEIGATQATPIADDNRAYVGTDRGAFYAVDRHSAKPLWKFTGATDAVLTAPSLGGGRIYFESNDNYVYGLAASTGGQIWKFLRPDGSLGYGGLAFTDGALYVAGDSTLYKLDASSGKQVWHTPVGGKSLSAPVLDSGRVYVGGDGPGLTALASSDGHALWAVTGRAARAWFGAPVIAGGVVYAGTNDHSVYAVDAATGKVRWSAHVGGASLAAPALDAIGHTLYCTLTGSGETPSLVALDTRTGAKVWDYRAGAVNGGPVVSGNRLYVGATTGYFYDFTLR
jgi:outer membrane protein assembly factor BamB